MANRLLSIRRRSALTTIWLSLLVLLVLGTGCATTAQSLLQPGEPGTSFYVINYGWHTGIVIRRTDIPPGVWPESEDFPKAEFLEVGWGDWDFYQTPDPSLWVTSKAAFWPTASVLHVVGFAKPVADFFAYNEIVEVKVPPQGAERLARFIARTYQRSGAARAEPLGPGLYGDSRFYAARGSFHVFNNCNTWTARALAAAGLPPRPWRVITAGGAMAEASAFGQVIR